MGRTSSDGGACLPGALGTVDARLAIRRGSIGFVLAALATILRDGALAGLVVFFLWREVEPRAGLGWEFSRRGKAALPGIGLFVLLFPSMATIDWYGRRIEAGLTKAQVERPGDRYGAAGLAPGGGRVSSTLRALGARTAVGAGGLKGWGCASSKVGRRPRLSSRGGGR